MADWCAVLGECTKKGVIMKHAIDFSTFGDKENNSLFASRCMKDLPYVLRKKEQPEKMQIQKVQFKAVLIDNIHLYKKVFWSQEN